MNLLLLLLLQPDRKLNAVTAVWKQKYQDMIVERVELEQTVSDLQLKLEQSAEALKLQVRSKLMQTTRALSMQ